MIKKGVALFLLLIPITFLLQKNNTSVKQPSAKTRLLVKNKDNLSTITFIKTSDIGIKEDIKQMDVSLTTISNNTLDEDGVDWASLKNEWNSILLEYYEEKYGFEKGRILLERYQKYKKWYWSQSEVESTFTEHDKNTRTYIDQHNTYSDKTDVKAARDAYIESDAKIKLIQRKYDQVMRKKLGTDYIEIKSRLEKFNNRASEKNGTGYKIGLRL